MRDSTVAERPRFGRKLFASFKKWVRLPVVREVASTSVRIPPPRKETTTGGPAERSLNLLVRNFGDQGRLKVVW